MAGDVSCSTRRRALGRGQKATPSPSSYLIAPAESPSAQQRFLVETSRQGAQRSCVHRGQDTHLVTLCHCFAFGFNVCLLNKGGTVKTVDTDSGRGSDPPLVRGWGPKWHYPETPENTSHKAAVNSTDSLAPTCFSLSKAHWLPAGGVVQAGCTLGPARYKANVGPIRCQVTAAFPFRIGDPPEGIYSWWAKQTCQAQLSPEAALSSFSTKALSEAIWIPTGAPPLHRQASAVTVLFLFWVAANPRQTEGVPSTCKARYMPSYY